MSLDSLGGYAIIELLARGGMAEVYLASTAGDASLRKQVAIKRVLKQFNQSSDFIKMFHDEAKVAIQLRHKNIVTVYDFGFDRGYPFLVMEYVPGQSLHSLKNRLIEMNQYLSIDHALYLIKEIASGLAYAHNLKDLETGVPLNLVHRDITPQNILFGTHGDVKIIDFGVARSDLNDNSTKVGVIKGKYGYLSPEQLHLTALDSRSDLFSLGVVFYELLFNRKLFQFNTEIEYFAQLRSFRCTPELVASRELPTAVVEILLKLLQPDRDQRYLSASHVLEELTMTLHSLYPRYTEMEFAKFMDEWMPSERISFNSTGKSIKTGERVASITLKKQYNFRLPKGFAS
jgi:eukaryotic-like serine/threonine-protein kinase